MSAAQPLSRPDAGLEISLRLGQHVSLPDHKTQRVTGVVRGLAIESDGGLYADVMLDKPIVIPARNQDERDFSIWHQHVPCHEVRPLDERGELIDQLLAASRQAREVLLRGRMEALCAPNAVFEERFKPVDAAIKSIDAAIVAATKHQSEVAA